jgi:hypothetical protein
MARSGRLKEPDVDVDNAFRNLPVSKHPPHKAEDSDLHLFSWSDDDMYKGKFN